MIIRKMKDITDVLKILPIEVRMRRAKKMSTNIKDFLVFIQSQFNNPYMGCFIGFHDNAETEIAGYAFAAIDAFKLYDDRRLQIERIWTDSKNGTTKEFEKTLCEWGKEHKADVERLEVSRHVKAIQRKYKFKLKSVVLERRI